MTSGSILVSAILPAYHEPYLQKTIDSLLDNAEGTVEVIPVLDGYWPDPPLKSDPRVRPLHLGKNRQMRECINAGVKMSRGKYIMRVDAHCMFAPGYDRILTETCEDNWIVTPRRYYLDPVKWERMDLPPVDYERLVIQSVKGTKKFTGLPTPKEGPDIMETQAMQGSCWLMPRSWWDSTIKELQTEGYGPMYQDSHEMVFKTWKAGGKLMVNKKTWFAHKHVSFTRTHDYGNQDFAPNLKYSYDTWIEYYKELKHSGALNR